MEITLIAVTLVALALAIAMSVFASRLLKDDRGASDARVETLAALAAVEPECVTDEQRLGDRVADRAPIAQPRRQAAMRHVPAIGTERAPLDVDWPINVSAPAGDLTFPPRAHLPQSSAMFGATSNRPAPTRRWLAVGLVAIATTIVAGVVYSRVGDNEVSASTPHPTATQAATAEKATPDAAPLELLSLRHEAGADHSFTITGLVQNPAGGAPLRHVLAVVYLFDRDGNYFASARASLDVADLHPGDQSPFVVRLPNADRVGRYRVGFRTDESGVVAHVDKRGQPAGNTTGNAVTPSHASGIE